jgi:hypothetical protein
VKLSPYQSYPPCVGQIRNCEYGHSTLEARSLVKPELLSSHWCVLLSS